MKNYVEVGRKGEEEHAENIRLNIPLLKSDNGFYRSVNYRKLIALKKGLGEDEFLELEDPHDRFKDYVEDSYIDNSEILRDTYPPGQEPENVGFFINYGKLKLKSKRSRSVAEDDRPRKKKKQYDKDKVKAKHSKQTDETSYEPIIEQTSVKTDGKKFKERKYSISPGKRSPIVADGKERKKHKQPRNNHSPLESPKTGAKERHRDIEQKSLFSESSGSPVLVEKLGGIGVRDEKERKKTKQTKQPNSPLGLKTKVFDSNNLQESSVSSVPFVTVAKDNDELIKKAEKKKLKMLRKEERKIRKSLEKIKSPTEKKKKVDPNLVLDKILITKTKEMKHSEGKVVKSSPNYMLLPGLESGIFTFY